MASDVKVPPQGWRPKNMTTSSWDPRAPFSSGRNNYDTKARGFDARTKRRLYRLRRKYGYPTARPPEDEIEERACEMWTQLSQAEKDRVRDDERKIGKYPLGRPPKDYEPASEVTAEELAEALRRRNRLLLPHRDM